MPFKDEVQTFVIYDIEEDRIRTRIAETCKDYGLERIQYSAFAGPLNANKREELFLKLRDRMESKPGRILVQPVCRRDLRDGKQHAIAGSRHDSAASE